MSNSAEFNEIELTIDGQRLPAGKAGILFQADPYPGGHAYTAVMSGKGIDKLFSFLPVGKSTNISKDAAQSFFMAMQFRWVSPPEEQVESEYFLNSVGEIEFTGKEIKFSGVCSEIISDSPK